MAKNEHIFRGSWRNILAVWQRATLKARTEGEEWYIEAYQLAHDLAEQYGCTPVDAAGVIAVLSPQLSWGMNVDAARQHFEQGWTPLQTRANNAKAGRASYGDHDAISGPKVRAFRQAIIDPYGDSDRQTRTRRLLGAHCAERGKLERVGVRQRIQSAYRRVADLVGQPVHVVQAVTWVQWRDEIYGNLTDEEAA